MTFPALVFLVRIAGRQIRFTHFIDVLDKDRVAASVVGTAYLRNAGLSRFPWCEVNFVSDFDKVKYENPLYNNPNHSKVAK